MTAKHKHLASILNGHSNYDDRLWKLLNEFGFDNADINNYDYTKLLPYFLFAGATIDSEDLGMDALIILVKIDEAKEEDFYRILLNYLREIQSGMRTY